MHAECILKDEPEEDKEQQDIGLNINLIERGCDIRVAAFLLVQEF